MPGLRLDLSTPTSGTRGGTLKRVSPPVGKCIVVHPSCASPTDDANGQPTGANHKNDLLGLLLDPNSHERRTTRPTDRISPVRV